jgi:hypothetical protein
MGETKNYTESGKETPSKMVMWKTKSKHISQRTGTSCHFKSLNIEDVIAAPSHRKPVSAGCNSI